MLATEQRLERSAERLADRRGHGVALGSVERAIGAGEGRGLRLGDEQRGALERITGREGLSLMVRYAGTGNRVFRATEGCAPSAYRDACRKAEAPQPLPAGLHPAFEKRSAGF